MNRLLLPLLLLLTAACHAPPEAPPPPEPVVLVPNLPPPPEAELSSEELEVWLRSSPPHARQQAAQYGWKAGPTAVPMLIGLFDAEPPETARAAQSAFWSMVHHYTSPRLPRERRQFNAALGRELEEPHPIAAKRILIEGLSVTGEGLGDAEAAGTLLRHPELGSDAMAALERIPHPVADERLLEELDAAAESGDPARAAALARSLGARRSDLAGPALLALTRHDDAELADAARHALARAAAPEGEDYFLALARRGLETGALPASGTEASDALRFAEAWRDRGHPLGAAAIFASLARHPAPHLRAGALHGAARVSHEDCLGLLLDGLADEAGAVRGAARDGLVGWPDPEVRDRLASAVRHRDDPVRAELLRVRVARADLPVSGLIADALISWGPQERLAGLELAAQHGDPRHEASLRSILERGTAAELPLAESALLAVARAKAAARDMESALVLFDELIAGSSQPSLVARARDQAARARLAHADELSAESPVEAATLLDAILLDSASATIRAAAAQRLRALGVDTKVYALRQGFLTDWSLFGPEALDARRFATHPFGASGPDPAVAPEDWLEVAGEDLDGVLDFLPLFDRTQNQSVYAYACFDWPRAEEVQLKIGSDDGVVVWLNDDEVHRNEVARGLRPDQDVVTASLTRGRNCLLVKITQGGGDWRMCVRLADADGQPIDLSETP